MPKQSHTTFPSVGLDLERLFPLSQADAMNIERALLLAQSLIRERGGAKLGNLHTDDWSDRFQDLRARLFGRSYLLSSFAESNFVKLRDVLPQLPTLKEAHRIFSGGRSRHEAFPKLRFGARNNRPAQDLLRAQHKIFLELASSLRGAPPEVSERRITEVLRQLTANLAFEPQWLFDAVKSEPEAIARDLRSLGQTPESVALAVAMDLFRRRGPMPRHAAWLNPKHFVCACIVILRSIRNAQWRMAKSRLRGGDSLDAIG